MECVHVLVGEWSVHVLVSEWSERVLVSEWSVPVRVLFGERSVYTLCPSAVYFVRYTVMLFFTISRIFLVSGTIK